MPGKGDQPRHVQDESELQEMLRGGDHAGVVHRTAQVLVVRGLREAEPMADRAGRALVYVAFVQNSADGRAMEMLHRALDDVPPAEERAAVVLEAHQCIECAVRVTACLHVNFCFGLVFSELSPEAVAALSFDLHITKMRLDLTADAPLPVVGGGSLDCCRVFFLLRLVRELTAFDEPRLQLEARRRCSVDGGRTSRIIVRQIDPFYLKERMLSHADMRRRSFKDAWCPQHSFDGAAFCCPEAPDGGHPGPVAPA